MSVSREPTVSVWADRAVAKAPSLEQSETTEIVVVGSGIAGLSVAYELAVRGHEVVVIDRGPIGQGMTARTTAHLVSVSDDSFARLIDLRGEQAARDFYASQAAAIDRIEAVQNEEEIRCDFRRLDGVLFPALGKAASELDRELEAAEKLGVPVEDRLGLPFHGLEAVRCLRFANQAAFHPLKYLRGLVAAIKKRGGRLFADTTVKDVQEDEKGVAVRTTSRRVVRARSAVVATNSPIAGDPAIHDKQAPYRSYAMAFAVPHGALPDALYWDTHDPYHYVRLQPGSGANDALIVGGEDHKTGEADDAGVRFEGLEAWIHNLVPKLGPETHRWSGQVLEPEDYAAFIGLSPGSKRTYVVTGDSGQGITHGAVAGLLIADLIEKRENDWKALYDPGRKTGSTVRKFIAQKISAVKGLAESLAPDELPSAQDVKPGHGAIIRHGSKKVAAYRDETGTLHACSAECTHAGCQVRWNSLETCWDCPCHGSQFAIDGAVLNAPAVSPLEPAAIGARRTAPRARASRTTDRKRKTTSAASPQRKRAKANAPNPQGHSETQSFDVRTKRQSDRRRK